jgi:hypothetical protein
MFNGVAKTILLYYQNLVRFYYIIDTPVVYPGTDEGAIMPYLCSKIVREHLWHKVLTYIEYRAVSGVFRTIEPHPLSTQRVSSPRTKGGGGGGVHTRRAVRGWGVNSSEDARH